MAIRKLSDGFIVRDRREFYTFILPDGREVETKAESPEKAKEYIERCLDQEIKEVA